MPKTEDKVLCCTITKNGKKNYVLGYCAERLDCAERRVWVCGMNGNVIAWKELEEFEG